MYDMKKSAQGTMGVVDRQAMRLNGCFPKKTIFIHKTLNPKQTLYRGSGQHIVQRVWSTHCTEFLANTLYRGSGQYIVQRVWSIHCTEGLANILHRGSGQYIVQRVWPIHCTEGLANILYRGFGQYIVQRVWPIHCTEGLVSPLLVGSSPTMCTGLSFAGYPGLAYHSQALIQEFRRGGGWTQGVGAGGGWARGSFFLLAVDILCMKKCSLGQVTYIRFVNFVRCVHFACMLSKMSKCKSILDFFKFNSESEILKGPDHSEPSVSGLPVTCVSYESESMDDTDSDLEAV